MNKMIPKIQKTKISAKIYPEYNYKIHFDGCSKGNPGLGGAGALLYKDNQEIMNDYLFVGEKVTNNYAEYKGLILGLNLAIERNIKCLLVEGDSLLIINQMSGKNMCKSTNLLPLYNEAKELEKQFDNIMFNHILRQYNERADKLSNIAVEEYVKYNE